MPRSLIIVPSLLLAVAAAGCDSEGLSDADQAAIRGIAADFSRQVVARDFDGILAQRTDSVVWMPPGTPAVKGKAGVRQFLESGPTAVRFENTPLFIDGRDDMAYVRGTYIYGAAMGADTVTENGKYVAILFRQPGGGWLVGLEVWNSDASSPSP